MMLIMVNTINNNALLTAIQNFSYLVIVNYSIAMCAFLEMSTLMTVWMVSCVFFNFVTKDKAMFLCVW